MRFGINLWGDQPKPAMLKSLAKFDFFRPHKKGAA
jgi:hypothetical protein